MKLNKHIRNEVITFILLMIIVIEVCVCEGSFKGLTSLGEVLLSLQSIDSQNQCSCYPRWLLLVKMLNKGTWDSVRIENSSICERVLCPGKRSLFIFQPLCFAMLECNVHCGY